MSGKVFNIVIVGDSKTGKTTMIQRLIDTSVGEVPSVMANPIRFPPSQSFFENQGTTTIITDTPSPISSEAIERIDRAISNAHAVCIVCDMTNPRTIKRVRTYWVPHIRQLRPTTPFSDNEDLPSTSSHNSGWKIPASPIKNSPGNNSLSGTFSDSEEDDEEDDESSNSSSMLSSDGKDGRHHNNEDDDDDDDEEDDDDDDDVIIDDGSCDADNGTIACIPIIIAGNKVDSVREPDLSEFDGLMDEFGEIETCLTCSAFQTLYVSQLFALIEKAIVYPNAPLYDSANEQFTKRGQCALSRIFTLLDRDNDGLLNDNDLQTIQQILSGDSPSTQLSTGSNNAGNATTEKGSSHMSGSSSPSQQQQQQQQQQLCYLTPKQIEAIKKRVSQKDPEGIDENGFITLSGFFSLNSLWIRKKNLQSTWSILYAFGYNTWLEISDSVLSPPVPEALRLPPGYRYELGSSGVAFLRERFMAHDHNRDGFITQAELRQFFRSVPAKALVPWGCGFPARQLSKLLVESDRKHTDGISLEGLLAQFHLLCLLDQQLCLRYFAYLGFGNGISPYSSAWEAFTVVREPGVPPYHPFARTINSKSAKQQQQNEQEQQQQQQRNVYMCYVFGSRGSGKTSLLRALVGKPFSTEYVPSPENVVACSRVARLQTDGAGKYLCMIEFINDDDTAHNRDLMSRCDVICLVHDVTDPSSFSHVHRLHNQILGSYPWIPCIHASTKIDQPAVRQLSIKTPEAFFQENMLQPPCKVSLRDPATAALLFETLVAAAESPCAYLPKKAPPKKGWSLFGFNRQQQQQQLQQLQQPPHQLQKKSEMAIAVPGSYQNRIIVPTSTKLLKSMGALSVITLTAFALVRWRKVIRKRLFRSPLLSWVWKIFPMK